jgi:hypothetical protein
MTYNLKKLTLTDAHDSQEISLGKDKFQLKVKEHILDLQLPMQSVPITTNVASLNPVQARCTRYNIMC